MGNDLNTPTVDVAYAVRGGMPNSDAIRTLTLDAAKILGVDHRIGSLEKGKDADILILDGDPLHYRSFVETAIVSGRVVYEIGKEPIYSRVHRQGNK
jgi:imidazolonepropionase-like amidohydrolase